MCCLASPPGGAQAAIGCLHLSHSCALHLCRPGPPPLLRFKALCTELCCSDCLPQRRLALRYCGCLTLGGLAVRRSAGRYLLLQLLRGGIAFAWSPLSVLGRRPTEPRDASTVAAQGLLLTL